ncbi:hypothetical protein A3A20_01355 [Candidatus Wolfebacteria bacterium RIFCSPLOWO2_01_FULL_45_19]|uniref:Response regulatory domain-containing protein n=1 Tax=Candidatus Wolfebacteria bacterium RIFCSPLOWO2_01_FULL_45_19 TaxID=1802557 RepID=A0A1F8DSK3_9BACT|nr:MAG: Transcriptional regulatory protein [Parcubacteria group bacterium GW2011_GWB1_45_9]OGM91574.1 MAG: hypothetical protein A3A20_01355 [Candidatus Wolfebacteria bacterium RIFCSPLOWO2_01_FULL_45_19]
MNGKTILLVEDDVFLSSLLKTRLQKENFTVIHAPDGEEALKFLRDQKPDLVLLDIILPKKSGFEVLEAIRSDPQLSQSQIVIISNLGQESDIQTGKELGAIEYFVKAKTSIDELVVRIKDYMK